MNAYFSRIPIFVGIVWVLGACNAKETKLPIEGDKLVRLLEDVHLAETALQNVQGTAKDSLTHVYYKELYTIHQVDSATLRTTLEILRKDPEKMVGIYNKVIDKVTNRHKFN